MNTHKVYTREQLESYDSDQLDAIYYTRVGYRPIKEDGISHNECIALILDYQSIEADERHNAGIEQRKPAPVPAHTPGPWVAHKMGNTTYYYQIETQNGKWIADVKNIDSHSEANARLISLAPETAKERDELKEKLRSLDATTSVNYQKLKAINTEMLEVLQRANRILIERAVDHADLINTINSLLSRARQ